MKNLKKIFYFIISYILSINIVFWVWNETIKDWLKDKTNPIMMDSQGWMLDDLLLYIKTSLTSLLTITVVWVFIYLWIKLVLARWNPEEFKKVMSHFVYVAIWIFIISFAYAAVKLVSWLNLFENKDIWSIFWLFISI